jgi:hypothetical protein
MVKLEFVSFALPTRWQLQCSLIRDVEKRALLQVCAANLLTARAEFIEHFPREPVDPLVYLSPRAQQNFI